jgi:parallel beta-helix repeat protein
LERYKVKRKLMSIFILTLILTSLTSIGTVYAKPTKFKVDDDYDASTRGWQITHFATIQAAIDAASDGDTLMVYAGTYVEAVTIDKSITLKGEDPATTTVTVTDPTDPLQRGIWVKDFAENVKISGFTVTNTYHGIYVFASDNCIITGNIITENTNHGIVLDSCDKNKVNGNTITNNGRRGIFMSISHENEIIENTITGNGITSGSGIWVDESNENEITSNTITDNGLEGIYMYGNSRENMIIRNTIERNVKDGIRLEGSIDPVKSTIINGNTIRENSESGIEMNSAEENVITGNTITENSGEGIYMHDGVDNENIIQNNMITDNMGSGIYLFNACDDNEITRNTVRRNGGPGYAGIYLEQGCDYNTIERNTVLDNDEFDLKEDSCTGNEWIHNTYESADWI